MWVEEWTSTEEETISEPVYQHYRYKLGTARYFMEYYDMEVKEYESGEYSTSTMSKSRKSDIAFRDREVPVIPRIYCSDSIRESKAKRKKPSVTRI